MWTGGPVPGVPVKPGVPSAAVPSRPGTPATDKSVSPGSTASPPGSGVARGDAKPAAYAAASSAAANKRRVETAGFAVAPTMVPPAPGSIDTAAHSPKKPAADASGPAPGAVDVDISFESSVAPAGGAVAAAAPAAEPTWEAGAAPKPENGPPAERAHDRGQQGAEGSGGSEAVPEWAGSAPSVGTVARLKGGQHRPYLVAGGVGVVVLAAVGVAVFGVGGKKQSGSEQKPAPVSAVVGSDKAAAPTQPATVEKPALSAAAVEPAKPQPAVVEKFEAPAAAEKPRAPAESKPALPEKAALAPRPTAERSRPAEKKVAAEKPAPAERPVSAKPVASPKPAVEKPVAAKAPSEPAPPPPEKKQVEAAAPAAQPATNRTQEAAEAYQRGNAKLLNGALPEAIAAFSEALKLNPKDAQSQRGLGMGYAQSGNAAQAVRHFKLYLKASPSAPDRALIEKRIDQLGGR